MNKIIIARRLSNQVEETAKAAKPLSKDDAAEIQHQMNEIGSHMTQSISYEGKGDYKKALIHLIAAQSCSAGLCRMLNQHQKRLKKLNKNQK